jgi:hypothetical protein
MAKQKVGGNSYLAELAGELMDLAGRTGKHCRSVVGRPSHRGPPFGR